MTVLKEIKYFIIRIAIFYEIFCSDILINKIILNKLSTKSRKKRESKNILKNLFINQHFQVLNFNKIKKKC